MADNAILAFANAIMGSTTPVELGTVLNGAFGRLTSAISSVSSAGVITWAQAPITTSETFTSSGTLSGAGLSVIVNSTSPTAFAYTLPLPAGIGVQKWISDVTGTTSGTATVTVASGGNFKGYATGTVVTFTSQGTIALMATTSSTWSILALSSGTVTVA